MQMKTSEFSEKNMIMENTLQRGSYAVIVAREIIPKLADKKSMHQI